MKCQHKSSGWKTTRFYVVDVPGPAVVGLPTSQILNLVTINVDLVAQGVIRKVDEHTHWCSSLAFSTQKDGSIRICLDQQRLNNSLNRCPHKIPTVEELNPLFAKAKVFSKLDAKAGYWAIHLEKTSQLLTTFRTPFGRYCWLRLPLGLNVSQYIFQSRMDQHIDGLKGVVSISDDIVVFGENEEDHDRNLTHLMKQAERNGLVSNSNKCHIKQSCVSFFGNRYTPDGIKPDPDKVRDIRNMPSPQSKEDVQRFLGLLRYLSPFITQLADKTHVLRSPGHGTPTNIPVSKHCRS